jgi:hypothetical protein
VAGRGDEHRKTDGKEAVHGVLEPLKIPLVK